jgi:hypothetical protein
MGTHITPPHQPSLLRFHAYDEQPFIVYEDAAGKPVVVDYSTCPPLDRPHQVCVCVRERERERVCV